MRALPPSQMPESCYFRKTGELCVHNSDENSLNILFSETKNTAAMEHQSLESESPLANYEKTLFRRLQESELFENYCQAFRLATGLPLRFMRADEEWCLNERRDNQSPFCELLHRCETACGECQAVNHKLKKQAEVAGPSSCGCFAGLCATAVPIRLGATTLGYIKTGQVFKQLPTERDFDTVSQKLSDTGFSASELAGLKDAYFRTQTIDPKRYDSMVALLDSFAHQLSQHAEELAVVDDGREPDAILRARNYIHSNLDEPLPLGTIAKQAGLSESHFCRVFKEITGMTLTDYVTRARIAWARKELLRPATRVSEIAFQVGFQSLSQFNRSFAKINGCSPSTWREQQLQKLSA